MTNSVLDTDTLIPNQQYAYAQKKLFHQIESLIMTLIAQSNMPDKELDTSACVVIYKNKVVIEAFKHIH